MVFSPNTRFPIMKKRHKAAVKAIAWSKIQFGVLASGGGTADCRIRLWNVHKQCLINEKFTGSQVCSVSFSKHQNEIISTHGFSQNEVSVWKAPSLKKVVGLTGHTHRVLYQAVSPDGKYVVTGAGDETLRFWDLNYDQESEDSLSKMGEIRLGKIKPIKYKINKKKNKNRKRLEIPVLR